MFLMVSSVLRRCVHRRDGGQVSAPGGKQAEVTSQEPGVQHPHQPHPGPEPLDLLLHSGPTPTVQGHSKHVPYMGHTHTVHIPYTHRTHTLHTPYTYPTHTVHIPYTHCTHTVHTLYTYCTHTVHIPYTLDTLHVPYTLDTIQIPYIGQTHTVLVQYTLDTYQT